MQKHVQPAIVETGIAALTAGPLLSAIVGNYCGACRYVVSIIIINFGARTKIINSLQRCTLCRQAAMHQHVIKKKYEQTTHYHSAGSCRGMSLPVGLASRRDGELAKRHNQARLRRQGRWRTCVSSVFQKQDGHQGEPPGAGTRQRERQPPVLRVGLGQRACRQVVALQRLHAGQGRDIDPRRDVAPRVGRGELDTQPLQRAGRDTQPGQKRPLHRDTLPRLRRRRGPALRVPAAEEPELLCHQGRAHPVCHDGRPHGLVDTRRLRHPGI